MSGEVWALILIVGFVVYRIVTRKRRKADKEEKRRSRQWAAENALPEVDSSIRLIQESIEIFRATKNQDTARSRYNLALGRLEELLRSFPHRTDWRNILESLQYEGKKLLQSSLDASILKHIEKANLAKTVSTKVNYLNKAIIELSDAKSSGEYNDDWIDAKRSSLEEMVHSTELGKLLETAERHEFKEDWKKALSAYQDVLFFLKKDTIDDKEQADLFEMVNNKIKLCKSH